MSDLAGIEFAVETVQGLEQRLAVTVPADLIARECRSRLQAVGRSVNVRGYRPGKIPLQILQQRFGPQVRRETLDNLVRASLNEAVDRLKLRPVGEAKVDAPEVHEGESLRFSATFEVLPDITLDGLESIPVERPEPRLDAADFDFVEGELRREHTQWRPVLRAARLGDRVTVNSSGLVDGQQVEGIAGERIPIVLGAGRFLLEIERPIVGMSAGEERQFSVDIPADFGYFDIAGRKVDLTVQVLEVAEPVLPELDAQFMSQVGIASGDQGAFRARVEQMTREDFERRARAEVRRQLFEHLVAANPIPVPEVLVRQEATNLKFASMRLLAIVDPDKARPIEFFRPLAEKRVRTELLMVAICESNGIALDSERVTQRLRQLGVGTPGAARGADPRVLADVEGEVREEQVAEWLERRAVATARPMTYRELVSEVSAPAA